MKKIITIVFITFSLVAQSQQVQDSTVSYKKRVLESTEIDMLLSYYKQDGQHSAVSGGIGSEKLTDIVSNLVVNIPLNEDDVLTIDTGISSYTSASSSNINPFNASGASGGGGDDDDDDRNIAAGSPTGTPWQASSGASAQDQLVSLTANYSHSSDSRNFIWNSDVSVSNEYDYTSVGFGGGIAKLFNKKNTEIGIKVNAYLDQWRPIYPTELHEYEKYGNQFQSNGYFAGVTIYDQNGIVSTAYNPNKFKAITKVNRNSYSASFSFSQIVSKRAQISLFFDLLSQEGLLSTPYQRIYFADKANYYIGDPQYIQNYETSRNRGVYRLADDIERLPSTRFKVPIGARLNFYINETFKLRTYYRYYSDDWGITAHTANLEIPVKISEKYSILPMYRYYTQLQSNYFAPFEKHLSTEEFYSSDYDLSTFKSNQFGLGISYLDIFTEAKILTLGLKNIDFRYNYYKRSDGMHAGIVTLGIKLIM
jgi:Protein of unknown function (DUF3570)